MAKAVDKLRSNPGGLRRGLMLYGSTAAMAAALMLAEGGLAPALAQEIGPRIVPTHAAQGDFIAPGPSPSPSFEFRSDTLDIVRMRRDSVLNWTAYDTAPPGGAQGNSYVNFLPAGTELRFTGNGESFTAINRVFTTPDQAGAYRGIAIQGRVTSYLFSDGPNSVGPVGGNIWFFSPGGILATGTSSFNVGSLVLSASDFDNFIEYGEARQIDLVGVADPFASVIIKPGARIELTQPNSSFAIVAPTIEQGGDVIVDGSVLYMSAVRGNLYFYSDGRIGSGIFEAPVAGNEIRHTGRTTGPASIGRDDSSIFDPQFIEFRTAQDVRVLLSGSLGYAPATDAALGPNGEIILSLGGPVASTGDLTLTSNTSIDAPEVELRFGVGEQLTMGGDANGGYSLRVSSPEASLTAGAGGVVDVAGNVTFDWTSFQTADLSLSAEAGDPNDNPGGRITVGGNLTLNASSGRFGSSSQQGGRVTATIGDGASVDVGGDLSLLGDAYAVDDDGDFTAANGGSATLTMTGNSSLRVGDVLTISAQGLLPDGNCECTPSQSGSATGGYAAFTATGGTIEVGGQLSVSASAESYERFFSFDDSNLDATGGTALVSLGNSSASFLSVTVSAEAEAARSRNEDPGGSATGGTARFAKGAGGSLAAGGIVVVADATAGEAQGFDGEVYAQSRGGDAQGGTASITLGQSAEGLGYLDLSASARAGDGSDATEFSAQSGGDGGDAIGGSATLTLSGEGTNLAGVLEGSLNVSASGGSGGDGEADYFNAFQAGDGGEGGSAQGGSLSITAADGAEFAWDMWFNGSANAGSGGDGGNQIFGEGGPSSIGLGADGGDAIGASFELIADGGTISGDLDLRADAFAGEGGIDGLDFDGNFTGSADAGESSGGSIALILRDNGAGQFAVGNAVLVASGDIAGTIALTDESTDPEAAMRFGSLYAEAYGEASGPTPAFTLSAVSNAVAVEGTAEIYAQSIALDFASSGRLEVGGFAFLNSDGGDIAITHTANPDVLSLHANGGLEVYADGNYSAAAGSAVASGDYALIRSTGAITAADTRSLGDVTMIAQGDVSVTNVAAGENFDLSAGRLDFDGSLAFQPEARATVSGTVTAGGSVFVTSGGFAEFTSSSVVNSDNDIRVRTGDDIIIASGASLTSDIEPDEEVSMHLLAGDINFGQMSGDLIAPIGTPIASLLIGGTLDTNGASLYLSGDAIDATGSSIVTGNLYADVTDAPPFGPYSNDGGLLPLNCRQGSACLGAITASGAVAIGLDSNNGLVSLRTGTINFTGSTFDVVTLERLDLNPGNVAGSLIATQRISLRSVNDTVALSNISLEAPTLRLRAGTDLAAATANLVGLDALTIEVGNDLNAGTIYAVNGMDDGTDSTVFTVPGDFIVGSLTYGSGVDMQVFAGGDLSVGFADPTGADIDLEAAGALFLGSTAANSGAIRLEGDSVSFNNLISSGLVQVIAGDGGISGLSEVARVIDTTGGIVLESSGDVVVGDLFAGTDIAISGAEVVAAELSAGGSVAVEALGAAAIDSFDAGGDAYFDAESLELGTGSADGVIGANAREGDLGFNSLAAGGDAFLVATGAILGGDVAAGGALTLLGGSIAVGDASGAIGLIASTEGDTSFSSLVSSAGTVSLDGGDLISGGSISAATSVSLSGGAVTLDSANAGMILSLTVNTLDAGSLIAGGSLVVSASETAAIDSFRAGGDASFVAASLDLGIGTAVGELGATASSGDLSFAELIGGDVSLTASGALTGGDVGAGGTITLNAASVDAGRLVASGDLAATIAGTATFVEMGSSAGAASLTAGGDVTGQIFAAGTDATLAGQNVALNNFQAGTGAATLTGADVTLGIGLAGTDLSVTADTLTASSLNAGGDLTASVSGSFIATLANAGGAITIDAASIALQNASFGAGLSLDASDGGITGSGLYQGTGAVSLTAAQGIAIGSLDTLGEIAMTAGAEARFVELRSRDGSVGVDAGGAIVGSSVAAAGSNPAGEDNVSLVADGAITLDGSVTTLNAASRAADDFIAQAGGALNIVRGEAGRDLSFTAGAGTLSAADAAAGRDLSLTGPAVQLVGGEVVRNLTVTGTGGDITGSGSTLAGGVIELDASGDIAIGSLSALGGDLAASAGGSIGFTDLYASGAIALSAGGSISGSGLDATNGIAATGASLALGDVAAGEGGAVLQATEGALAAESVTGAGLNSAAAGSLAMGMVAVGGSAQLSGASVAFDSVTAGGSVSVESEGEIDGGAVSAGGFASIYAQDAITLTGLTADDAFLRSEGGPVSASGIAIEGLLVARGTSLALGATGALTVDAEASSGPIGITSTGDLTVDAETGGDISLTSTGGSVIITDVEQGEGSPGGIIGEGVSGGAAFTVTAANGISVLDSVSAGGALTMTAGGLVSLDASASGQTIAIHAGDLAIGSEATLGGANTQRISLASRNAVNLGSGASGGFAVDAAEFARIQSGGDLMITALAGEGGGSGALTVGSLTVNAGSGGQVGTSGTVGLTAGGVLDVNSTLSIARAGTGNTLMLTGDAVDLDYANAQLSVLDNANASTGRIVVNGRLITSMSAAAAADIVGKTPTEIDVRLGQADVTREIGLFRTGNLTLEGRDAILIQNSGGAAVDARRGLTVGALTVTGRPDGTTLVVINGIIGTATGNDAAQVVTLTNPLAGGSTFNGCALANPAACLIVPEPEPPLITAPESILLGTGDLIQSEEEEDDEVEDGVADGKNEAPPIDTTRIDDPAGLPMIDDPVTGAGNEDLWQQPDE